MVSATAFAQQASPRDSVSGTVAGAKIKIWYGSPSVKGRTIGKEIAPYGKVWRLGANEATTFTTSKDIKVGGKELKAGTYTLYATPGESEWKFMFNSTLMDGKRHIWGIKMDGSTTDDPAKDASSASKRSLTAFGMTIGARAPIVTSSRTSRSRGPLPQSPRWRWSSPSSCPAGPSPFPGCRNSGSGTGWC